MRCAVSKQRGIAVDVLLYLIAALALVGAGAYGVRAYTQAIERAKQAENDAKALRADVATLNRANLDLLADAEAARQRQARTDQMLAEHQAARAAAQSTKRSIDNAIETALRARPESRAWADSPVPADVVASLRNTQSAAGGAGRENDPRAATAQPAGGRRDP